MNFFGGDRDVRTFMTVVIDIFDEQKMYQICKTKRTITNPFK